jgi:hypothetical protein
VTHDTRTFVHAVDSQDVIVDANGEWFAFAQENGAQDLQPDSVLGAPLWQFIDGLETKYLYVALLERVRAGTRLAAIPFRCDSPDCRRFMEMNISPIGEAGHVEFRNRVLREEPRDPIDLLDLSEDQSDDLLTMCSWCKRVRVSSDSWVEAEEAIRIMSLFDAPTLPKVNHGMCPACVRTVEGASL